MEILESTDHFLQTEYLVYDGSRIIAKAYLRRDAEVIKSALEEDKKRREQEDSYFYFK